MNVILQTERLLLREFSEADAPALLAMEREPEGTRYLGRKPLADLEACEQKIRSAFMIYYGKPGGCGTWAAIEKATGEFIGRCSLRPALDGDQAAAMGFAPGEIELGYVVRTPSWGQGYATEAARALVRKAFLEMHAPSVVAFVTLANAASVRVLEKAGLRLAGAPFCLPGESEPSAKYAIAREEFARRDLS